MFIFLNAKMLMERQIGRIVDMSNYFTKCVLTGHIYCRYYQQKDGNFGFFKLLNQYAPLVLPESACQTRVLSLALRMLDFKQIAVATGN